MASTLAGLLCAPLRWKRTESFTLILTGGKVEVLTASVHSTNGIEEHKNLFFQLIVRFAQIYQIYHAQLSGLF